MPLDIGERRGGRDYPVQKSEYHRSHHDAHAPTSWNSHLTHPSRWEALSRGFRRLHVIETRQALGREGSPEEVTSVLVNVTWFRKPLRCDLPDQAASSTLHHTVDNTACRF